MGVIAYDTFNRANETPLQSPWLNVQTAFNLSANAAVVSNGSFDHETVWNTGVWPNDQYAQAKVTINGTGGNGQGIGVMVRNASGSYYWCVIDHAASDNITLHRFNSGTPTILATRTLASWTDGAVLRLECQGSTLRIFVNGVQQGADIVDGSPLISGKPGIAFSSSATSASVDEFEAGDLTWPILRDYTESDYEGTEVTDVSDDALFWQAGDQIVVLAVTEDNSVSLNTPTGTGLSFTPLDGTPSNQVSTCKGYGWIANPDSAGSSVIQVSRAAGSSNHKGFSAWAFGKHAGISTPVVNVGPSRTVSVPVVGPNSTVVMILGDWNATADVAFTTIPADGVIREAVQVPGAATFVVIEWDNQAPGTRSYGADVDWTGTGDLTKIAVEVEAAAPESSPPPPSLPSWLLLQLVADNQGSFYNPSPVATTQVEPQAGLAGLGLSGAGDPVKVAKGSGPATMGLSTIATATKVVAQTGRTAVGLAAIATAKKVQAQASTAAVGIAPRATAIRLAPNSGVAAIGIVGAGAEVKKASAAGVGIIGFTPYGPTAGQRLISGRCAVGLSGRATVAKTSTPIAHTIIGLVGVGTSRKTVSEAGMTTIGISGRSTNVKRATSSSSVSLGVFCVGVARHITSHTGIASLGVATSAAAKKRQAVLSRACLAITPYGDVFHAPPPPTVAVKNLTLSTPHRIRLSTPYGTELDVDSATRLSTDYQTGLESEGNEVRLSWTS